MKRTDWFEGDAKPVHVGVYERKTGVNSSAFWAWNGRYWLYGGMSEPMHCHLTTRESSDQWLPWRGLAEKP